MLDEVRAVFPPELPVEVVGEGVEGREDVALLPGDGQELPEHAGAVATAALLGGHGYGRDGGAGDQALAVIGLGRNRLGRGKELRAREEAVGVVEVALRLLPAPLGLEVEVAVGRGEARSMAPLA